MDFMQNENQNVQNVQNGQSEQQANSACEYSFYPEDGKPSKKKRGLLKKLASVTAAILCVVAIGATSIFGYTLITGKNAFEEENDSSSKADAVVAEKDPQTADTDTSREIPSLYQLAALENALTVPEIVTKVSPSVVGVSCIMSNGTASGTGFVISEDGYIVTNYHVINGARAISVSFSTATDDEQFEAELIGGDEQTDIAVLKINKTGLTPVTFGKSSELIVGELAITIGNPLGSELSGTVTAGIISALGRKLTIEDKEMTLIQTDASINSGNSGGPLINSYGQVIGITSAKVSTSYGEGLGFAIPIDEALPIIEDLIEHGYVKGRPIVGISGEDISEIYAQYYDIPKGFIVRELSAGGPAEKAGVKVGDIVIGIEGTLIESVSEFNDVKKNYKAGDTITISVYRGKEIVDIDITLAEDTSARKQDTAQEEQNLWDEYNFGR